MRLEPDGSPLPAAEEPRYLYSLMAEHRFRNALQGLRDLDSMAQLLSAWSDSMEAFDDMLTAHRQRFVSRRQLIDAAADEQRLQALRAADQQAAEQLQAIREGQDAMALASEREQKLAERLDRALRQAAPGSPEHRQAKFLSGVLAWNVQAQFPSRLRAAEKDSKASERALDAASVSLQRVRAAEDEEPARFTEFNHRIAEAAVRLGALRERVNRATQRQAAQLENLAVEELTARQRRVTAYLGQARYALAASYDRAALAEATP